MSEHARTAAPGPRPVANQTRRDAVVGELRRAILTGELESGQRLREVQIAQQMGVSRPTLREAVHQLTHEGLLEQQPYRGVVVATVDEKFLTDVAAVRVALEKVAARAVADDPDGSRKALVRRSWEAYREAHAAGGADRLHKAHIELHRTIWTASDNVMLVRMWPMVEAHINLVISVHESERADPDRALRVHEKLVEAIFEGDGDTIDAEVEAHTRRSADELVELLAARRRGGGGAA
ncbi:GntR family transcriptional regulator [Streptomyces sp. CA-132043]|uniref:GntR family transcriptional regulator n=1 Tax=Streptomyces sp. CA-132043 TaxID=3240048 RepID=UPI003D8DEAEE